MEGLLLTHSGALPCLPSLTLFAIVILLRLYFSFVVIVCADPLVVEVRMLHGNHK